MRKKLRQAGILLFWLMLWQIAALMIDNNIIFAGPAEVLLSLLSQPGSGLFWEICFFSFSRICLGFLLAFLTAVFCGAAAHRFSFIGELLTPAMLFAKSVPVASFIILALIWMGSANLSVFIAFSVALPVIYASTLTGLEGADKKLLEMAFVFRMKLFRKIKAVYLPALLPHLISGSASALGLSIKSGIAAEVIGVPASSIGERLYLAKVYLDTADLFAWTLVIIAAAWLFEKCFLYLLNRLGPSALPHSEKEEHL